MSVGTQSRKPLSSCTPRQCFLASPAGPDIFPDSLPASCGALAPFRLSSHSQPQSSPWDPTSKAQASAPCPHPPQHVSRQASQTGKCWSAPILCAGISPLCPLHPCATLSSVAPKLLPAPSLPVKRLPSVWKPFSFPAPSHPYSFVSFFLLPYPGMWGFSCLFGNLRSSASVQ